VGWKPTDDIEREIRGWMRAKGWEVTSTDYNFDREVYAWRHDVRGKKPSPTLRISQQVLDHYPAFAVLEHLDRLGVADAIKAHPDTCLVVVQKGPRVTLEETLTDRGQHFPSRQGGSA